MQTYDQVKRFTVTLTVAGDGETQIAMMDGIEHGGQHWLVPNWLDNLGQGWTAPERIVLMAGLDSRPFGLGYLISAPVPKAILFGPTLPPPDSQYVVVFSPNIRLPLPKSLH